MLLFGRDPEWFVQWTEGHKRSSDQYDGDHHGNYTTSPRYTVIKESDQENNGDQHTDDPVNKSHIRFHDSLFWF